ncbi:hypothetical protein CMT42_13025 [Elizabethkingia anophelis]|uniref:hypothetical protein n=1 Tax=Elizabethkingia anophelis TaxID=1117645 RepID=UPI00099A5EF0|nr:hypothetical protein [Elizabethkingia anophelis]ELB0070113.1 hypothetical protein [Elizabethkingia anophelis]ELB1894757.1 hypothetical protein [Elizabethkingia anophelis]MCT3807137.1 hypothetical protein [Elizabethkingia anophelis]MCT3814328.1 hypothetical protein [Elizabethkingia anophelis]MCT3821419.1 hypothetical protein [Elizabethkingia anophelis]
MKAKLFFMIILIVSYIKINSQTVATLIAGTKALDNTVNNALEKSDNILSNQQRTLYLNLASYTNYLIGNLNYLSDDLNRKLTEKELAILNDITTISTKLKYSISDLLNGIEDGSTIIENSASRIIGSDKYPTPTFYKIPIITTVQNKNIVIDIKGVRLNNPNNFIIFNNKKVFASSVNSDKQISFIVPLTESDVFNNQTINVFYLSLFKKRFIGKDKEYKYTPKFVVLPQKIADVKVYYKINYKVKENANSINDVVHSTSGSNKTKDVERQFNLRNSAAEGWKIDKSSIKCWKEEGNGDKHGCGGPYENTKTDISFVAKAYAKDGKAVCRCQWDEYRYLVNDSIQISENKIGFNTQEIVQLPENLVNLQKTEVTYYDGTIFKSSKSYFKNNYVEFDFRQLEKLYEVKFAKD